MIDQRQSVRRRTFLDARISVEKAPLWSVDCWVRDISETGIRLKLNGRPLIPNIFGLGVSGGAPRRARLIWTREGQAGIELIDAGLQIAS